MNATSGLNATASDGRRDAGLLFLFFVCFYFLISSGHFFSTDEIHHYQITRSLVTRGDMTIPRMKDAVEGPDGRYYTHHKGVAPSVLAMPFYAAGAGLERWLPESWQAPLAGRSYGQRGQWGGDVKIFAVCLFNVLVSSLLCVMVYRLALELGFSPASCLLLPLLLGTTTIVCVYATSFFHHTLTCLALVGAMLQSLRARRDGGWAPAVFAGLWLACALLTRMETALAVPIFALYLIRGFDWRRPWAVGKQAWRVVGAFLVPIVAGLAVHFLVNYLKFGMLGLPESKDRLDASIPDALFGHLLSPGRSIFVYSPVLVLALLGWRRFHARHRRESWLILVLSVAFLAAYSSYNAWHGHWAWGNRYLLILVPFWLLPLGCSLDAVLRGRRPPTSGGGRVFLAVLAALALIGLFVQFLGTAAYIPAAFHRWSGLGLLDQREYIYIPSLSPVVAHWQLITEGRPLDYWLAFVQARHGTLLALGFAILPLAGMAFTLAKIFRRLRAAR